MNTVVGVAEMLHLLTLGLHEGPHPYDGRCVSPGQCTPPPAKYSKVIAGPQPGQQWNINGGFCGAFSTQHAALAFGAWVSQDLVRKANRNSAPPHTMHGDSTEGYEVMPTNVADTAKNLKLTYDEWDYTQPSPQAPAYKAWLKKHLVAGHPIVWFPLCKGDPHHCYPGSCPNGGAADHVEPMWGIFSNHSLDDPKVYDDDYILHASDQDYQPYYRPMSTLEDSKSMDGNCAHAGAGFGRNEMYPCFDESVTYGLAVTGLAVSGAIPVSVQTSGAVEEPNVRQGARPATLYANVTVTGLTAGSQYVLYRYGSTESLPAGPPFAPAAEASTPFTAAGDTHSYADPKPFMSDSAVYWLAAPATTVEAA